MRKQFLAVATVAAMTFGTAVAPAFASEVAPAATTTTNLKCTATLFGRTYSYPVTIQGTLPMVNSTFTQNGVTVSVESSTGKITLTYGTFASATCTVA